MSVPLISDSRYQLLLTVGTRRGYYSQSSNCPKMRSVHYLIKLAFALPVIIPKIDKCLGLGITRSFAIVIRLDARRNLWTMREEMEW